MISTVVEKAIRKEAELRYPEEMCGVIVAQGKRSTFVPVPNVHAEPTKHFAMCEKTLGEVIEEHGNYLAVVHSHPDGKADPSVSDLVSIEETQVPWVIVSVFRNLLGDGKPVTGEIATVQPSGYEAPLLGRPFFHGTLDCYTLVQDFYKQSAGVTLPHFDRDDKWWEKDGESLYLKGFDEAGFVRLNPTEPLRFGDVILMECQTQAGPNHAGVYLGNGTFVHHLYDRLSRVDVYGGYWSDVTFCALRYKDELEFEELEL